MSYVYLKQTKFNEINNNNKLIFLSLNKFQRSVRVDKHFNFVMK